MAALKPETKARRVVRGEAELRKAEKKFVGFDARKAKAQKALDNYTDEKRASYEKRYNEAADAVEWLESAPVTDESEYERVLEEFRAQAVTEVDSVESADVEDAA